MFENVTFPRSYKLWNFDFEMEKWLWNFGKMPLECTPHGDMQSKLYEN
jgi:hypothetical protein